MADLKSIMAMSQANRAKKAAESATLDGKTVFSQSLTGAPRLGKALSRKVITHLSGTISWASAGMTNTQTAPNLLKVDLSGANTYTAVMAPTLSYGSIQDYIEVAVRCPDWSAVSSITVKFVPDAAQTGSYWQIIFTVPSVKPANNTTRRFRAHAESFVATGTPGAIALTTAGRLNLSVATTAATTIYFEDGVMQVTAPNTHLIMFDDGFAGVYDLAFPILKARNIPATFFVVTDRMDTPGYVTWAQLREMQDAGWTIANHTKNHIDNLITSTKTDAITAVEGGCDALVAHGLRGSNLMAAPYNAFDSTVSPYVSHAVHAARVGMTPTGLGAVGNTHIKREYPYFYGYSVLNTETPQQVYDNYYLPAKAKNLAFGFVFHGMVESGPLTYQYLPSNFATILDMLLADGVTFATYEEWVSAYVLRYDDTPNYYK